MMLWLIPWQMTVPEQSAEPVDRDSLPTDRPQHHSLLSLPPENRICTQNEPGEKVTLNYACKCCSLEYNWCREQSFITKLPGCAIYLSVPCPMNILLPRNQTGVVDAHSTTRNVSIVRWIAPKAATGKLQSQTSLGNLWQDNYHAWESTNRKERRPSSASRRDKAS